MLKKFIVLVVSFVIATLLSFVYSVYYLAKQDPIQIDVISSDYIQPGYARLIHYDSEGKNISDRILKLSEFEDVYFYDSIGTTGFIRPNLISLTFNSLFISEYLLTVPKRNKGKLVFLYNSEYDLYENRIIVNSELYSIPTLLLYSFTTIINPGPHYHSYLIDIIILSLVIICSRILLRYKYSLVLVSIFYSMLMVFPQHLKLSIHYYSFIIGILFCLVSVYLARYRNKI